MNRPRVHVAASVQARAAAGDDVFERYPPPFDIESDLLLATGTCPAAPLRAAFPELPLRSIGSHALLGVWFARVHEIRSGPDGHGLAREAPDDLPYQELNVAVLLRGRELFVPGIYATSSLTLALGQRYGMPKRHARMSYASRGTEVTSYASVDGGESRVTARAVPGGRTVGSLASRRLPLWSWPVRFPSGSRIQASLEGAERVRVVWLREGRLHLNEPWLPDAVSLWRPALHVARLRMRLPDPARPAEEPGSRPRRARWG